jgi:hypothetical protein
MVLRPNQPSSAAAAALSDKELRQTIIAAAVGCSDRFGGFTLAAIPSPNNAGTGGLDGVGGGRL